MIYELLDCETGNAAAYRTTVDISERDGVLRFEFNAENSLFYCPYHNYNDIHSYGDACEILIGSDPDRKHYYELEISPENKLMCALMEYRGADEDGEPALGISPVEKCFLQSELIKRENGYTAIISFPMEKILSGGGEIFFNAYRLETDGGTKNKHLFALSPTMKRYFHSPAHFVWLKDYLG